jgi:type II secretory pathway component GspD/PulD (secretin)/nucleoid-associated protein YgaU
MSSSSVFARDAWSTPSGQGLDHLSRTAIVGIQVAVLSLGLAAYGNAGIPTSDGPAAGSGPTLLGAGSQEQGASAAAIEAGVVASRELSQEAQQGPSPQPPAPARGDAPPVENEPVPVAEPLPGQAAPTQRQAEDTQSANSVQSATARNRTTQPAARSGQSDRPQEINFDDQGLITMHTDELDVRQLLELISRRSGLNILVSPRVSGNITANFERISVEDLLRSVLKLANLVEKVEGDVHFIYSREDLRNEAEDKKKERILTKVYRLNYVRADELMVMIIPFLSQEVGRRRFSTSSNYPYGISESSTLAAGGTGSVTGGGGGAVGGMSGGAGGMVGGSMGGVGTIQRGTQPPTGGFSMSENDVVVIQDYESNLKIIDQIIQRIDVRPVQVLIEAVIISVELDKDKELGVNFALVDNLGQELGTIGSGTALNGNVGFTPSQVLTAAGKIAGSSVLDPTGFTSATNGIKYGFVSNNVTGFIRAIETLGSTKILASPRILVLNKQRAEIQLGSRLGFRAITTQNYIGTTQGVQFLNTGTLLRLRPFVSNDGMVRMEIHPERSQGAIDTTGLPNQRTAELTTNVMVPNGATLVIGGLMEDEDDYQIQGLPGLSRLPILGSAFGIRVKTDARRELVVLLTPHLWMENDPQQSHQDLAMRGSPTASAAGDVRRVSVDVPPPARPQAAARPRFALPFGRWGTRNRTASTPPSQAPSASALPASAQPSAATPAGGTAPATGSPSETLPRSTSPATAVEADKPVTPADGAPSPPSSSPPTAAARPIKPSTMPVKPKRRGEPSQEASLQIRRAAFQSGMRPVARHRVQAGETLQSIARRYYGSERFAPALWDANRGLVTTPSSLKPGMDLEIPAVSELDRSMVEAIASSSFHQEARPNASRSVVTRTSSIGPSGGRTPTASKAGTTPPARPGAFPSRTNAAAKSVGETLAPAENWTLQDVINPTPGGNGDGARPPTSGPRHDEMVIHAGMNNPRGSARTTVQSVNSTRVDGPSAPSRTMPGDAGRFVLPPLETVPTAGPTPSGEGPSAARSPGGSFDPQVRRAGFDANRREQVLGGPVEGGFAVHVVRERETLRSIARDRLGDPTREKELLELNRDVLGEDLVPTPGVRLLLPAGSHPPSPVR